MANIYIKNIYIEELKYTGTVKEKKKTNEKSLREPAEFWPTFQIPYTKYRLCLASYRL